MLANSEIPACAGMTERGPGDGELPGVTLYFVIPAQAGISKPLIRGDREVPVEMENCPG